MTGSRDPRTHPAAPLPSWLSRLLSLILALSLLVLPGSQGSSQALALPGRNPSQSSDASAHLPASAPSNLQEVAPPRAVHQLQEALAGRAPRVEILAPADETLLPPGPWTLQLRVHDWPLVDGGELGLGPHLVVQLDDEEPLQLTSTEITMAALRPGSHRLTVFAARPWGEAAKNPSAWSQIRLHRAAANPLGLPEPGQAQLIAVSPGATAATEPLLLDWLLLNAPLQNLRSDDARWRLRITINGDGFVVDRQTPLWLKGWQQGRNAIKLELLDGRGAPLTPPYNSLVREVELNPAQPAARWQQGALSAGELAILLGEATAEALQSPSGVNTEPQFSEEDAAQPRKLDPASPPTPAADVRTETAAPAAGRAPAARTSPDEGAASANGSAPAPKPAAAQPCPALEQAGSQELRAQPDASGAAEDTTPPAISPCLEVSSAPSEPAQTDGPTPLQLTHSENDRGPEAPASPGMTDLPTKPDPTPSGLQAQGSRQSAATTDIRADRPSTLTPSSATSIPPVGEAAAGQNAEASAAAGPGSLPTPSARTADLNRKAAAPEVIPSESTRLSPSSSSSAPAQEQVNPNGTMVKPPRRGPLAGLRERLLP